MSLKEFLNGEKKRLDKQRKDYLDLQGFDEFVRWEKGSNKFTLQPIVPRDHKSFGREKKVFKIEVNGVKYDWSVTPESPIYRQLIYECLSVAPVELELIRIGEGTDTKYDLVVP